MEDPGKSFDALYRPRVRLMSESQIELERAKYIAGFRKQNIGRRLKDGDVVDPGKGIRLRVIHLPGHSLGSVGYFWEKEGIAAGASNRPTRFRPAHP